MGGARQPEDSIALHQVTSGAGPRSGRCHLTPGVPPVPAAARPSARADTDQVVNGWQPYYGRSHAGSPRQSGRSGDHARTQRVRIIMCIKGDYN